MVDIFIYCPKCKLRLVFNYRDEDGNDIYWCSVCEEDRVIIEIDPDELDMEQLHINEDW